MESTLKNQDQIPADTVGVQFVLIALEKAWIHSSLSNGQLAENRKKCLVRDYSFLLVPCNPV